MKYKKKIPIPMYRSTLYVKIGTNEEIIKDLKKVKIRDPEIKKKWLAKMTQSFEKKRSRAGCCIILPNNLDLIIAMILKPEEKLNINKICDVIPHEVRHYVDHITERLGIDDTESAAYLTGYLCSEIMPDLISLSLESTVKPS